MVKFIAWGGSNSISWTHLTNKIIKQSEVK